MPEPVVVTAADIARLTGYGRAAVSNWRRRHDDFPQPVGGTASSPLFALSEVESWLSAQGKPVQVADEERLWQQIRTTADDLQLATVVAELGRVIASGTRRVDGEQPGLHAAARSLAGRLGKRGAFEFLVERYVEAHSRRVTPTPREAAALMAELAGAEGGTVLDPACGIGTLLVAAAAHAPARLLGQERDDAARTITDVRVGLRGVEIETVTGDSLCEDGFAGERVDVVLCDPPFGERNWGYDELTSDPRWTYGLPPRGESELAWVQHALWHLRPGGRAAILMPTAAADRRSGRRIRSQLLRAGALRAVIELPAGFSAPSAAPPHLWLLRRPAQDDPLPSHVLMVDASALGATEAHATVVARWRAFEKRPEDGDAPGVSRAVPLVDLLDDVVDLGSGRHVPQPVAGGLDYETVRRTFLERLAAAEEAASALVRLSARNADVPMTTVGELLQSGSVSLKQTPIKMETDRGELSLLTAKDMMLGRPPSGRTTDGPGVVVLRRGDVVVPLASRQSDVLVVDSDGVAAGPQLQIFRPDLDRCDPGFLACFLRASGLSRVSSTASRMDVRRAAIPRLPIERQRPYGLAFERLQSLSSALRAAGDAGETLVDLGFEKLGAAALRPEE